MKTKTIIPTHDNVIIECKKPNGKIFNSKIIFFEKNLNNNLHGIVVAVNKKFFLDGVYQKSELKIGDNVIFDKKNSLKININDKELVVVKEKNICCIINSYELNNSKSKLKKNK